MAHSHAVDKNYYLDQLCSLGACGAIGLIGVLMYTSGKLGLILVPAFHVYVLVGGILLLTLVLIRGVNLWRLAGRRQETAHDHHHEHGEPCDHDHDHHHEHGEPCDHDHEPDSGHVHASCGHDHDHTWMPAKYALLLLPIILFLLELPNAAFSADYMKNSVGDTQLEGSDRSVAKKSAMTLGFRELKDAAGVDSQREYFEGHMVKLKGMYVQQGNSRQFTLVRLNMKCCGADAIPIGVVILSPTDLNDFTPGEWVEAQGKVEFRKVAGKQTVGKSQYVPLILLESADSVRKIPPEPNPYEY